MPPVKKSLAHVATQIDQYWDPHILSELNGQHVRLAKLKGEFVWHSHESEDEMFLILEGDLTIKFRDGDVWLGNGDILTIPAGVEHKPVAEKEVLVLLFEPAETLNTGEASSSQFTRQKLKKA